MIAHPTIVELYAGERLDWVCLDMEHTSIDIRTMHECILASKGSNVDLLLRLPSHHPDLAKRALDAGVQGLIFPNVQNGKEAEAVVAMTKYPPEGNRGVSLSRSTDFGRKFESHFQQHNHEVLVIIMIEHASALPQLDSILGTPGIDAVFIGPYDLSASMGLAGQLDHPDVLAAQDQILKACQRNQVAPGIHVVPIDRPQVRQRVEQGFRLIACGLDTEFILHGCRAMLE